MNVFTYFFNVKMWLYNGYVYETFGISKHFPVKLQVLLIRAEMFHNALTAKCFIYDVTCCVFLFRHKLYLITCAAPLCFKWATDLFMYRFLISSGATIPSKPYPVTST